MASKPIGCLQGPLCLLAFFVFALSFSANAAVKKYDFNVQVANVRRLCNAKPIVTVNGMFPGPPIYVREGDQLLINVTNSTQYNMSIHWHGLKQFRNGWADGPAYITQGLVHALSSRTSYNVGPKDGLCGGKRKVAGGVYSATSKRPPILLDVSKSENYSLEPLNEVEPFYFSHLFTRLVLPPPAS